MRVILSRLIVAVTCLTQPITAADAHLGTSRQFGTQLARIAFGRPVLAPFAHTRFCLQNAEDCEVHRRSIRYGNGPTAMTQSHLAELRSINLKTNAAIRYAFNEAGVSGERWEINPETGDCNDYAVSKRHDLLLLGWRSRDLLLAEVVVASGEHHLVLVVRTLQADFVLDSLTNVVKPVRNTRFQWVRIQSEENPKFWRQVKLDRAA